MGYEEVSKAYRVYDIEAKKVVISRDVNFDESVFGFSSLIDDEVLDNFDFNTLDLMMKFHVLRSSRRLASAKVVPAMKMKPLADLAQYVNDPD